MVNKYNPRKELLQLELSKRKKAKMEAEIDDIKNMSTAEIERELQACEEQ